MKRFTIPMAVVTAALALGASDAQAGNLRQYSIATGGAPFEEITDGTPITNKPDTGTTVIFPDYQGPSDYSAQGFEIGFDFRLGGRLFDQFVVSSSGGLFFGDGVVNYGGDAFAITMTPVKEGFERADITYKTVGTPGDRICIVQYGHARMATQEGEKAECSLQFRLHEKDGKIELCFREEKAPATNSNGFNTSLQGWDANDVFVATAQSMVEDAKLSTFKKAYMLDSESYIHWTATGDLVE